MEQQSPIECPWTGKWFDSKLASPGHYFSLDEVMEAIQERLITLNNEDPLTGEGAEVVMDMKGRVFEYAAYGTRSKKKPFKRNGYHCGKGKPLGISLQNIDKAHVLNDVKVTHWHLARRRDDIKRKATNFDYFIVPLYQDKRLCETDVSMLKNPGHFKFICDFAREVWAKAKRAPELLTIGLHTGNQRTINDLHIKMRAQDRAVDYFDVNRQERCKWAKKIV
jgi:hypothetical protein